MIQRLIIRRFVVLLSLLALAAIVAPPLGRSKEKSLPFDEPRFRLAIAGINHAHAWGHLRRMTRNPAVELVGIADEIAGLREEAAKAAPDVAIYEDYRKLLDEKKPEAVWSFVENSRHLEVTRACATRGIHVIFEKPMAATYDQAKEMLALANKHKIKLMVNYQMAWWPENYAAHNLAESGKLGKVWRVRSIIGHGGPEPSGPGDVRGRHFWDWLNDEQRGGGALLDFTCYGAVWLRWYLGLPKTVYAVTTHTRTDVYKTNTTAAVLATFADNGIGIIEASWDLPRGFQDVEVLGNRGSVFMARNRVEASIGNQRQEIAVEPLVEDRRDALNYFIRRVRANQPIEGMVGPKFNVEVMQIVEAARRSAKSGKPVSLPLQ